MCFQKIINCFKKITETPSEQELILKDKLQPFKQNEMLLESQTVITINPDLNNPSLNKDKYGLSIKPQTIQNNKLNIQNNQNILLSQDIESYFDTDSGNSQNQIEQSKIMYKPVQIKNNPKQSNEIIQNMDFSTIIYRKVQNEGQQQKLIEKNFQDNLKDDAKKAQQYTVLSSIQIVNNQNQKNQNITLSEFQFIKQLGRGAIGKVILVQQKQTNQFYAMKIMKKQEIEQNKMTQYIQEEKKIMQFIDHPFIVKLHFAFQTPERLYLIQDFMIGGELFFHLQKQFKFTEDQACFYAAQLILAIEYLHEQYIMHRDIKAENILLDQDGNLKITDFGLSKRFDDEVPNYGTMGTLEYMAPEIMLGKAHSKVVDWYSFGVILYEMLSGKLPFQAETEESIQELKIQNILKYPSFFTIDMRDIISKLLEINPQKRLGYEGAYEIKQHKFFSKINFDNVYKKLGRPPFVPKTLGMDYTGNFDADITEQTMDESHAIIGQHTYKNFDYIK